MRVDVKLPRNPLNDNLLWCTCMCHVLGDSDSEQTGYAAPLKTWTQVGQLSFIDTSVCTCACIRYWLPYQRSAKCHGKALCWLTAVIKRLKGHDDNFNIIILKRSVAKQIKRSNTLSITDNSSYLLEINTIVNNLIQLRSHSSMPHCIQVSLCMCQLAALFLRLSVCDAR